MAGGKLIEREPIRAVSAKVRHLYVTREVADLIDGTHPETGFPLLKRRSLPIVTCSGT